jgi:hypothetical protein
MPFLAFEKRVVTVIGPQNPNPTPI